MKRLTPQLICIFFACFVTFCSSDVFAQSASDRTAVKEWIVANKDNITLVSSKEYLNMSPAVKAMIDADSKTIVYNHEVTIADIQAYQNKNNSSSYLPFKTDKERVAAIEASQAAEKEKAIAAQKQVDNWLFDHKGENIKIISYQDYMNRSATERVAIDNLSNKIIYNGEKLTWKDIELYEQSR